MKLLTIVAVCAAYFCAETKGDPVDCSRIFCALYLPVCEDGAKPIEIRNSGCCPEYKCPKPKHCSNIRCLIQILCAPGYEPHVRPNHCCPDRCKKSKCSGVSCPPIKCPADHTLRQIPGQCCPVCAKNNQKPKSCADILCVQAICPDGYSSKTLPQQCCPTCKKDNEPHCSLVRCAEPVCEDGSVATVPDGKCCKECP